MKNLILFTLLFFAFQANAQLSLEGGQYVYHKTFRVKGTQEELYAKVSEWVASNFKDGKSDIQLNNVQANEIVVSGNWYHELAGVPNSISYTYKIEFLNGMYRESFRDLSYLAKGRDVPFESKKLPSKKAVIPDANKKIKTLSNELNSFMQAELMAMESDK